MDIPEHLRAVLPKVDQDLHDCKKCLRRHIEDICEAQAGKDICDRLIGPEKTCVKNHVKQENDVDTASQLCAALCTITTLTGHHSVVEYEPFQTASTPAIPVRKTAATKNFARWSEVWIDKTADGKFQKLRVREQFEIGNFTHLLMQKIW